MATLPRDESRTSQVVVHMRTIRLRALAVAALVSDHTPAQPVRSPVRRSRPPVAAIAALLAATTLVVSACRPATETSRELLLDVQLSPSVAALGEPIAVEVVATNGSGRSIEIVSPGCLSSWFYVLDTRGPVCALIGPTPMVLGPGESHRWRTAIGPLDSAVPLVPGHYVGVARVLRATGERVERRVSFTVTDSTTQ
jgi:hypothetical protein